MLAQNGFKHMLRCSLFCELESKTGLTWVGRLALDGLKLVVMDTPRLAHHETWQRL